MGSAWFSRSVKRKRRSSGACFVPRLELLEGRTLPSKASLPLQIVKLEERIAPRIAANHNETLVRDTNTSPPLQIVKLEERIAPRIAANHNETLMSDG
jgi:hypothetical protein